MESTLHFSSNPMQALALCRYMFTRPERRLKKGSGYHLDLVLVGALCGVCGMLGLPMPAGATVRSIAHLAALSLYDQPSKLAPGERPHLRGAIEQRLTGLIIHVLCGLSMLLPFIFNKIPVAVLIGLFLYIGCSSLTGIQFFERIKLLFMPAKHHPDVTFVKHVRELFSCTLPSTVQTGYRTHYEYIVLKVYVRVYVYEYTRT